MEKSAVFIDAGNVISAWRNHCLEKNIDEKIDYIRLVEYLSIGTNLLRAYFYDGVPEVIPEKKKIFIHALEHKGIQMRTKMLKRRIIRCEFCNRAKERPIQKGVDVSLATDILRHGFQKTSDICIIVSGDEDFKDAMDLIKDRGIKVWVCSFKNSLSSEVKRTADRIIYIDDIFDEVKKISKYQ